MKTLLLSSLVFVFLIGILCLPSASALPVSYNTTSINLGLTSVPRNSSSYDVFTLNQDNWLWEKFDNTTIDSGPLSVPATITYNTNAKAVWHFENVLTDSSTSARTLTKAAGTTTYTTSAEEGSGLVLDGSTYFTASDGSLPTGTNPVSITSWIQVTSFASSPAYFQYGTGAGTLFGLSFDTSGHVMFKNGSTTTQISTTALSINTFYYLSVTYDGTNARVYINGSLDKTTAVTVNTSLGGASGLSLGALSGGSNKMTGKLDEFRVYSGTALTLQQHQALYMVGHYSQSHTFDGGEYVKVGGANSFNLLSNGNPFTLSYWSKIPIGATSSTPVLFDTDNGGGIGNIGFTNYISSGTVNWVTTSGNGISNSLALSSSTYPDDGLYHYMAYSFDGTTLSFYLDGILQKTAIKTGSFSSSNPNHLLYISSRDGSSNMFTGQLDNVKVYPYALSSSQITSDFNSISPISSGKQFMSWYNGVVGSSTLTQKLGSMKSSLSLSCTLPNELPFLVTNTTNIYYICHASNIIHQIDIQGGTDTTYFKIAIPTDGYNSASNSYVLFKTIQNIVAFMADPSGAAAKSATKSVNNTLTPTASSFSPVSNQKVGMSGYEIKYNTNSSVLSNSGFTTNACEINYTPTSSEKLLGSEACDGSLNPTAIKYWNGMNIQGTANYATNSTQVFLNSIDSSSYKKLLSLPCPVLVNEAPCTTFIMTDFRNTDYLIVMTSTHVYYGNAQNALSILNNNNYALQSYDIITQGTSSVYEIQNPILQSIKLYGPINLNSTLSKAGLFTLPSGYTVKTTSIESAIRTIDPRWTNDATDIPIITSTGSLFPIYLTVSNAPVFSAIKVTNPYQLINSQESIWAVAQLDSTRTVEFDLPSNVCVNVYIADISVSPSIWNFQGIICASGVNQKTISYTNTLPFTFWTYPWGASDSFTPNTNGLVTTVRHTTAPFSYNIVLKNSTGNVFQNTTYTSNSTIDTQNFNLTGRAKPVSLYINSVTGGVNQIYSAFLGSPISLASTASFFNQYFSYQGFNLLAFIPIIFASMFTRNTIGIGVVLTVLCIATLSWLSVVVIPELDIMIMIVIAIIGLIAYRLTYY